MPRSGLPKRFLLILLMVIALGTMLISSGCGRRSSPQKTVTIYCSQDQVYAEPILQEFQRRTGIVVNAKYDSEAVKTVGLVNAIVAEREHPRCDVLWNNEVMHTVNLKRMGLLAPYVSASAQDIPDGLKDKEGYWTGIAARGRVIIYNKEKLGHKAPPSTLEDFLNPQWKGKAAIALPLFGTTATHGAALFTEWGEAKAKQFFQGLKANGIAILPGNARVKDQVASGGLVFGLTDTDDAHVALLAGSPVGVVFPDQKGRGTLILPNTIAMIKGCPHPEEAKLLVDYLVSKEVEEKLALGRSAQMPLHPGVKNPPALPELKQIKVMKVDYEKMADIYPRSSDVLKEMFLR